MADADARRARVHSYTEHFRELRGRDLAGSSKPVHYVGAMGTKAARRTRSRREIALRFDVMRDPVDADSAPLPPPPVSDELKLAAIEAIWNHQAWREATWLGHPVARLPSDLYAYQELLSEVRPDVVIVIGDDPGLGGRALFLASVCDQLGRGRVLAVGRDTAGDAPAHDRIVRIVGAAETADTAAEVASHVEPGDNAVVLLGLGAPERVIAAFDHYSPFVRRRLLRGDREHGCARPTGGVELQPGPVGGRQRHPRAASRVRRRPQVGALHRHLQQGRLPETDGRH